MEKTEVNRINHNGPKRVAASEVKSKRMKLDSTFYDHVSPPLINMDIATLMVGIIDVTKMRANIFMQIG